MSTEKQEPYGYFKYDVSLDAWVKSYDTNSGVAFYTHPPKREWVSLTDEEIHEADRLAQISHRVYRCNVQENTIAATDSFSWYFVHFINAKLREKNG